MKKTILFLSMFAGTFALAQDCSELFISEYVEGWSNNKALEIYNPTSSAIDLSGYVVARYSNGSNSASTKDAVQLSGTIQPYDVYVAVLDKRDPNGQDLEAPVWDSLQAKADGFYSPVYNTNDAFYWNGDDVLILFKGTLTGGPTDALSGQGLTVVDIFAKLGEQPTNEDGTFSPVGGWSTAFPYNGGTAGVIVTRDHSMIRKQTVLKGATSPTISFFNPLEQWDTIPPVKARLDENGNPIFNPNTGSLIVDGNWSTLGSHLCNCDPTASVGDKEANVLSVFPNPTNGIVYVKGMQSASVIEVYNSLGQKVETVTADKTVVSINLNGSKGVYLIKLTDVAGNQTVKRVVLK